MLLYNGGQSSGSGDFISVNIVNGFLVLSYDLGSGVARISSLRSVLIQFLIPWCLQSRVRSTSKDSGM